MRDWYGDDWLLVRLLWIVPLLLSLAVHEWAHAWSAFRLGDDTAARQGRMTLNPLAHIDPIGTLLLPLLGVPFGWAKPVPVNPSRFHRGVTLRTGIALTAAAGPLANLGLALAAGFSLAALARVAPALAAPGAPARDLLETLAYMNVALAFFNLIPIPPLDGSRLVDAVVPDRLVSTWNAFARLGPAALAAVILVPIALGVPLFAWPFEQTRLWLAALLPGASG